MKKITIFLFGILMVFAFDGWGQDIAAYSGKQTSEAVAVTNATATALSQGPGVTASGTSSFNSNGWNTGNEAAAISDNDYIQWSITAASGYTVKVTSIEIDYDRSGTGPSQVSIRTSLDSYDSNIFTDASVSSSGEENTISSLNLTSTNGGTITFRLYGYSASSGAGTFDIEDDLGTTLGLANIGIILDGTVDAAGSISNPTAFTATTASTSQIDLAWTENENGNAVLIAWNSSNTFGTPVDGTSYSNGSAIPDGGTSLGTDADEAFNHTSLDAGTLYFYKIWSVDGSDNYSSGVADDNATYKDEPTNHVTSFVAANGTPNHTSIDLTWVDATGASLPDNYLIKGSDVGYGSISAPSDGTAEADGGLVLNVTQGTQTTTFHNLTESTTYYFKIWPYTNTGTAINYKTDATVPSDDISTLAAPDIPDLIISEVADPKDFYDGRFVELYNLSGLTIDFDSEDWYLVKQTGQSGGGGSISEEKLTGSLASGGKYSIANNSSNFNTRYDFVPNLVSNTVINGNGDDAYYLYFGGGYSTGTLVDVYGEDDDGSGLDWEYLDSKAVRLSTVTAPNTTWTASEWNIPSSADVDDMTPSKHKEDVTWQGTTNNSWNTKGNNWNGTYGYIPDASFNVTIPQGASNYPTISAAATCNNLTIESNSSGDGSLMGQSNLTVSGTTIVERYTTASAWHGISSPVSGADFNSLYLNGSPDVWGKSYNELDNTYTSATSLSTALGDMKGWMVWIEGSTAQTFDLTGSLRSGTIGSDNNLTHVVDDADHGYNFVGNPFPSAIDWDAAEWTKTDIGLGIWILDDANDRFASYITGTGGTNGGTQYISSGQAFFVQVDVGSSLGTLKMTDAVQVHNTVGFFKEQNVISNLIKLKVSDENSYDESIIRLDPEATEGFESNLDMHKMFSYNEDLPQLFSTANDNMVINVLPLETVSIPMDVIGKDGNEMNISIVESNDFDQIFLSDDYLGTQTNLMETSYSFIYDAAQTDRFTVYFTLVGMEDNILEDIKIYSYNNKVKVEIPLEIDGQIQIVNLMGQIVKEVSARSGSQEISIEKTGYYLVRIIGNNRSISRKVFIQ